TAASVAPRRAGEAKEKGPKKPSEAKKDPPSLGEEESAAKKPPKPCTAKQMAPKKGNEAKDIEAKLGEARKAPPKPDKATQALSSTSGLSGKSKVKGSRSGQGDAEAHRKTKPESKSSKPTAKVKNGSASPARKKMAAKAPQGAATQGSREGPNTKATSPAKGSGSKMAPAHLARKTEAPMGPRRPGLPVKASASKVSSKRAEA
ncbi:histone H1.8 isoform 2, partial [Daubentonia madagascariensis]